MKKILFAMTMVAAVLSSCGGSKSGGTASNGESSNGGSFEDGKWPTAVYDQFGIPEFQTKGKIVYTEFPGDDGYRYSVYYNNTTREEVQAWLRGLLQKGYRMSENDLRHMEGSDEEVRVYLPEEGQKMVLYVGPSYKYPASFDYYFDGEPNPAFTYEENPDDPDGAYIIKYDLRIWLHPINQAEGDTSDAKIESMGLEQKDFAGIPHVLKTTLGDGKLQKGVAVQFLNDHQLTKEDAKAAYDKVVEALASKGATFMNANGDAELTAQKIKDEDIRMYTFKINDKKYLMMCHSDARIGDFGGLMPFIFQPMNK